MVAQSKAAPTKSKNAAIVSHEVVALDSVSLAVDSGWRDLDQEHVEALVNMILEGNYSATALAGPSLISEGGRKLTSREDGKYVIRDLLDVRSFCWLDSAHSCSS